MSDERLPDDVVKPTDEEAKVDVPEQEDEKVITPFQQPVEDEVTDEETSKVEEPEVTADNARYERWWTVKGPKHAIVGKRKAHHKEPSMIPMKDYVFDCDMSTEDGRQLSKDFRTSGYWGADLHIVTDIDLSTDEGKAASEAFQSCVIQILEDEKNRGLRHIASILTNEEAQEAGINKHNPDKVKLINTLFTTKSFILPSMYSEK